MSTTPNDSVADLGDIAVGVDGGAAEPVPTPATSAAAPTDVTNGAPDTPDAPVSTAGDPDAPTPAPTVDAAPTPAAAPVATPATAAPTPAPSAANSAAAAVIAKAGAGAGAGAGSGAGARAGASATAGEQPSPKARDGKLQHKLKLLVCSWNVGNKPPPADMSPWLPKGGGDFDVIAVGVQESKYSVKSKKSGADGAAADNADADSADDEAEEGGAAAPAAESKTESVSQRSGSNDPPATLDAQHFFKCVQLQCGGKYETIQKITLWEMRLIVLVKKKLKPSVKNLQKAWEATGALSVCGNKGGLVVKFDIGDTSFCFISCHLAAHARHLKQRNKNVEEVLEQIRMGPRPALDIDHQFHHVFWFGDLNYRVQLNSLDKKEREINAHIAEVKKMIAQEQWPALYAADQLQQEMYQKRRLLPGFKEAVPTFPPTFKVERAPGYVYQTKKLRVPSYCDRVLFKAMPGREDCVRLTSFDAFPSVCTSDHKPVSAQFEVDCRAHVAVNEGDREKYPQILITSLRAEGLHPSDTNGLADPYIKFLSDPPSLFTAPGKKPKQTEVIMTSLSPKWADDQVPELHARVSTREQLARCTIVMSLWDWDRVTPDDPMGQCTLGLSRYCRPGAQTPVNFDLPVSRHGRVRGRVKGTLEILWPTDPRHTTLTTRETAVRKGCCVVM